jgi:hypothetical protein
MAVTFENFQHMSRDTHEPASEQKCLTYRKLEDTREQCCCSEDSATYTSAEPGFYGILELDRCSPSYSNDDHGFWTQSFGTENICFQ